MAYKIGDKFVIEIDSVMTNKKGTLYGIKGLQSPVFDESALEQLEQLEKAREDNDLKVGDIVFCPTTLQYALVTKVNTGYVYLLFKDGSCGAHSLTGENWKKVKSACRLALRGLFGHIAEVYHDPD